MDPFIKCQYQIYAFCTYFKTLYDGRKRLRDFGEIRAPEDALQRLFETKV
jgi:hypothetical protein